MRTPSHDHLHHDRPHRSRRSRQPRVPMSGAHVLRYATAVAVAAGGYTHFDLYRRSYHAIPRVGVLFALNVIASAAITAALVTRHDRVTRFAALALTAGTLVAFALSRTTGLAGFKETGLTPRPQAAITLAVELAAAAMLIAASLVARGAARRHGPNLADDTAPEHGDPPPVT